MAGIKKEEQVADYDGSYECLICSESVRGTAALKCTQCQSNPVYMQGLEGSIHTRTCASVVSCVCCVCALMRVCL